MKLLINNTLRACSSVMLLTVLLLSMLGSLLSFQYCDMGCCESEVSFSLAHHCEGNSCCQTSVGYTPQAKDCCENDCCNTPDHSTKLESEQEDCRCHFIAMGVPLEDCSEQALLPPQNAERFFLSSPFQQDFSLTIDAAAKRIITQGLRGSPRERIDLFAPLNLQEYFCCYLI